MNYYQFHISDWALHTSHLTLEEEAVYRRLLDYYYDTESPIPEKTQPVIRRLRLGSYEVIVDSILAEFFVLDSGFYHNLRADQEIKTYHDKAERARENGRKGGRPKKNNAKNQQVANSENPEKTKSVILANPEKTESKANQEPRTNNQEPDKTHMSATPPCPHQEIVTLFSERLPVLPSVRVMTDKRKRMLAARWREDKERQSIDWWERYFDYVNGCSFLLGSDGSWQANFDWLINPSNMAKVIEGNYEGKR